MLFSHRKNNHVFKKVKGFDVDILETVYNFLLTAHLLQRFSKLIFFCEHVEITESDSHVLGGLFPIAFDVLF